MNEKDRKYFEALHRDRADSAKTLEKPSMRGIKKEVVEKYSDQAHFIYELLQNADDAQATYARFILEHDRLIFAHNGTRHFSVSNPETEDADSENGTLGDINAITSIANSNKTSALEITACGVDFGKNVDPDPKDGDFWNAPNVNYRNRPNTMRLGLRGRFSVAGRPLPVKGEGSEAAFSALDGLPVTLTLKKE